MISETCCPLSFICWSQPLITLQQKHYNLKNLLLSYNDVDNPRPETANAQFSGWKTWVSSNFTWLYIGSQVSQKKCCHSIRHFKKMYLILRTPGCFSSSTWPLASSAKSSLVLMIASQSLTISLGEQKPWLPLITLNYRFSMLFACGIGSGLFFFSVSEPISHYTGSFPILKDTC